LDRQRILGLVGFAGLLIYAGWIGGPYLRSIIIRDAAVTTWISIAASPISGYVDLHPLYPGTRVGADGRIAIIENPLVDGTPLARAQADLDRAKEGIGGLEGIAATLEAAADARAREATDYAAAFKLDLDARIAAAANNISGLKARLALERTQSDRLAKLLATGHASQSAADVAAGLVIDHERALTNMQAELDRATIRREAAEHGVFLLNDGDDGAVAQRSLDEIRLIMDRTALELAAAKIEADTAEQVLPRQKATMKGHTLSALRRRPVHSSGA
jgi:hypothetical protein